ncbi:endonuclease exonuclease phosphatase family protein [Colletotrichum kahawae]|uniref:Endonuclease exonuclease phosphatase family protein n=1 Tax=Colletotrichum kahawae TaxID=34407 RepID=A0AAD9Y561_COLKA|nr:endonuclease exonuclease phosphatase family protein [Colletotrichum kahawae]
MGNYLSIFKSQGPPLKVVTRPADQPDLTPVPQSWHEFDEETSEWTSVENATSGSPQAEPTEIFDPDLKLTIATWNVDAFADFPAKRLSYLLSRILDHAPVPDIRDEWYSSEKDTFNWGGHLFATMTLLSKARFGHLGRARYGALGRVSRIKFRSYYGRDALCSEIFLPSNPSPILRRPSFKRIQLINVHLDSLARIPSLRPHQLWLASKVLREAGYGLVAGDFNPVLPEDETLIEGNHLVDAWKAVRGEEPGYTWGVDGNAPFPPNRMDKVTMVGLTPVHMEVMHPDTIVVQGPEEAKNVPWSDHSGLKCTFTIDSQ